MRAAAWSGFVERFGLGNWIVRPKNWRQGVQLAVAVAISFALSRLLRLPEGLWAVMSTLIVMRPTAGLTLAAGTDRLRGTVAGALIGLVGVGLHRLVGGAAAVYTMGTVALLALSSGWLPSMRSAPITALIVLSSLDIQDRSSIGVAGLRVAEIGLGIVVGLCVSFAARSSRAHAMFDLRCAASLRRIAADIRAELQPGASNVIDAAILHSPKACDPKCLAQSLLSFS